MKDKSMFHLFIKFWLMENSIVVVCLMAVFTDFLKISKIFLEIFFEMQVSTPVDKSLIEDKGTA